MSLSPETIRIQHRLREWTKSGRIHWDLFRYVYNPHIIYDALKLVIKNKGAPGLDGETITGIKGQEWAYVHEFIKDLKAGSYEPGAVRRVYVPKRDGEKRPLGIPNLRDRILQRALVLLLEPIYETKFYDFSFGFRPGRKAVDCAAVVAKVCYKLRYVLDADIEKFFDNVDHAKLLKLLGKEIVDPRILRVIKQFLRSGFQEPGKPWERSPKGTPQGGPLSPLLSNIFLHYLLDSKFVEVFGNNSSIRLIRYADDFVILTNSKSNVSLIAHHLRAWFKDAGLSIKSSKTKWVNMTNECRCHSSKFEFLGFKFHLRSFADNPHRYWIARQPSERARRELKLAIRERLSLGMSQATMQKKVLEIWRGWCGYFRYSNANRIFYREIERIRRTIEWWLARKYRRQRCPVPWRKLYRWGDKLCGTIKPISVIPNHLSEAQLRLASL